MSPEQEALLKEKQQSATRFFREYCQKENRMFRGLTLDLETSGVTGDAPLRGNEGFLRVVEGPMPSLLHEFVESCWACAGGPDPFPLGSYEITLNQEDDTVELDARLLLC